MNELDEIAKAATRMVNAFDNWLTAPDNSEPEAKALMEARNALSIKLNAYNAAFKDLLKDQTNEQ
jgi:hypothetical protein